jgi:hypothetical protein
VDYGLITFQPLGGPNTADMVPQSGVRKLFVKKIMSSKHVLNTFSARFMKFLDPEKKYFSMENFRDLENFSKFFSKNILFLRRRSTRTSDSDHLKCEGVSNRLSDSAADQVFSLPNLT